MSESCSYCSVYPRHPCRSSEEAARCPNCPSRGFYLNFKASEVAEWIRDGANGDQELLDAADLIERRL